LKIYHPVINKYHGKISTLKHNETIDMILVKELHI